MGNLELINYLKLNAFQSFLLESIIIYTYIQYFKVTSTAKKKF